MRNRWLLIGAVVAVNVLGELLLFLTYPSWEAGDFYPYMLLGMVPAHASLLAFWAAFGGRATPWRLVASLAGVVGLLWLADRLDLDLTGIWLLLLLQVPLAGVLLLLARFFGAELRSERPGETAPPLDPQRQWLQFSIWSLLSWTTALALMLSLFRILPQTTLRGLQQLVSDSRELMVFGAMLSGATLIALSAMWVTLGTRWPLGRYVLLGLTGAAAACLLVPAVGAEELGDIVVFCCAEIVWMAGSLWLVRLAGYRLVWRRRVAL